MKPEWIPLSRVGEFELNKPIEDYIQQFGLIFLPDEYDPVIGWQVYALPNKNVWVYSENERIVSISCYEQCFFKDRNLIGITLERLIELIGCSPEDNVDTIYIDNEPQQVYEFPDVGAQIWVKQGLVASIVIFPEDREDD